MKDEVVLVDKNDRELGVMDKLAAHKGSATLHRAISVLLYRDGKNGKELLLQQRSRQKPLWPMIWDSTCSTHPFLGESYKACAVRRLKEEMGINFKEAELDLVFKLYYQADYNSEFSEHEVNGILVGKHQGGFKLDRKEVVKAEWVKWEKFLQHIDEKPSLYAPWLTRMFKEEKMNNFYSG